MNTGYFSYPMPVNEPVLTYGPGTAEKKRLKEVLAELKAEQTDVPMYIGGQEVRTGEPLYRLHAQYDADLEFARRMAQDDSGYRIGTADQVPREFVATVEDGE